MQDYAFIVFGERRSHNRYTNQTQRTIKVNSSMQSVTKREKTLHQTRNRFLCNRTEANRHEFLMSTTTYNKIKRTAKYKFRVND